ncbi:MAG: Uncharacterized protein XD82_1602, partial [Methanoculleus marisnigri]
VACTWDSTNQRWVQMTATSKINPLDSVYILMNDYDRLPVAISPDPTNPPVKMLQAGWNLVGPAYDLVPLNSSSPRPSTPNPGSTLRVTGQNPIWTPPAATGST